MKRLSNYFTVLFVLLLLQCCVDIKITKANQTKDNTNSIYYGIKINDVLCGYVEASEKLIDLDNKTMAKGEVNIFFMLSALGSEFNTELNTKVLLDPTTRRSSNTEIFIKQGSIERTISVIVVDQTAIIYSSLTSDSIVVKLSDDVLFGGDHVYLTVKNDFLQNGVTEKTYRILEVMDEEIQTVICRNMGNEIIEFNGRTFNAMIIEMFNENTGLKTTHWLAANSEYFVKTEVLNRVVFLADRSVIDRIKVANMDQSIFTNTNESITDVRSISYMKLKAKIQPSGVNLTSKDLNINGQKFDGTVIGNLIDGIFEINYPRYNGEDAPSFPYDYSSSESLSKYLKAESIIQSDDPVLVSKAEEITDGSGDSWEAATRISKWVAENISYAIPGGGSARKTYDIRAGECGAHSMLVAAFCRAVGIPSRVVWGAMYVPNRGGGFGQHGWNEIYMGVAGWIPVDATAFEMDFVDAGHIRIAELQSTATSFNGKEITILDYKLLTDDKVDTEGVYSQYLGKYTNRDANRTFEVLEKDGNLSLDIPGQMVLPFHDANEDARWYCKLTPNLYLEFESEDERIEQMILHEIIALTKEASTKPVDEDVPTELLAYMGEYNLVQASKKFKVIYLDNSLAVKDPDKHEPIKLKSPDSNGGWLDEFDKNTIYFEQNQIGKVDRLKIDASNRFVKED